MSRVLGLLLAVCLLGGARELLRADVSPVPSETLSTLPPRMSGAPGGQAFVARIRSMTTVDREAAILAEVARGNVPNFLRRLVPVTMTSSRLGRPTIRGVVWVMPDYLAIGSDEDFVRVPLSLYTASAIARRFDLALPTRRIVDAVYRQAAVKLAPIPMKPGPTMRSVAYFARHNQQIEQQRHGQPLGALTAGDKKDLVLTNRLERTPGRVAIYGWHRRSGLPIQPLSLVHGAGYADYSHGERFVSRVVVVDGRRRDLFEVLGDTRVARLLTEEGSMPRADQLLNPARPVARNARRDR